MPNASPLWLSIIFFVVGFILFSALAYVNPESVDTEILDVWIDSLKILLYVFIGLAVFLVVWILSELYTPSEHYGVPELLGRL